jgi:hypothetical protein
MAKRIGERKENRYAWSGEVFELASSEMREIEVEVPASVSKTGEAYIQKFNIVNRDALPMTFRISVTIAGEFELEVLPTPKPTNGESHEARDPHAAYEYSTR